MITSAHVIASAHMIASAHVIASDVTGRIHPVFDRHSPTELQKQHNFLFISTRSTHSGLLPDSSGTRAHSTERGMALLLCLELILHHRAALTAPGAAALTACCLAWDVCLHLRELVNVFEASERDCCGKLALLPWRLGRQPLRSAAARI